MTKVNSYESGSKTTTVEDRPHDDVYNFEAERKAIVMPRVNHKVEQIVRAVLIGFVPNQAVLNVDCGKVPLICQFNPDDHVIIGIADERGYRLSPESNSALIWLGLHPTAFLYHLTTFVRDGVPVVRETDTGFLAIEFGALVQCARNATFQWNTKEVINGVKQYRKPILEEYIFAGKPKTFA